MRDLKKIKDQTLLRRIRETIERVEASEILREVPKHKKLSGADDLYRIRVGDYSRELTPQSRGL